jgi:hypothetical protein
MARDYKHRAHSAKKAPRRQPLDQPQSIGLWKWMLITALIISFVVFLVYLRSTGSKQIKPEQISQVIPIKPEAVKRSAQAGAKARASKNKSRNRRKNPSQSLRRDESLPEPDAAPALISTPSCLKKKL